MRSTLDQFETPFHDLSYDLRKLATDIKEIQDADYRPSYIMTEDELEHRRGNGAYPYIPFRGDIFLTFMKGVLKITEGRKFVEAGSGSGALTWAAAELGCEATGIEIDSVLCDRAVKRFPQCQFVCADILDCDYSQYDIIYFYTPFIDHDKEVQFEKRVASQAKTGAIIIGQMLPRVSPSEWLEFGIVSRTLTLPKPASYFDNILHEKITIREKVIEA